MDGFSQAREKRYNNANAHKRINMAHATKINWKQAAKDYFVDPTLSYEKIAKKYGVTTWTVYKRATKENWGELRDLTQSKGLKKVVETSINDIGSVRTRHADIGRVLQSEGLTALKKLKPKSFGHVWLAVKTGVEIERKALDLEKPDPNVAIQINFGSSEVEAWAK